MAQGPALPRPPEAGIGKKLGGLLGQGAKAALQQIVKGRIARHCGGPGDLHEDSVIGHGIRREGIAKRRNMVQGRTDGRAGHSFEGCQHRAEPALGLPQQGQDRVRSGGDKDGDRRVAGPAQDVNERRAHHRKR